MKKTEFLSFDFETYLISEEMPIPKPVCMSVYDGDKEFLAVGRDEMLKALEVMFTSNKVLVAHNMQFEGLVIYKWFPTLRPQLMSHMNEGLLYCTKLYEKLLGNTRKNRPHQLNLAALVMSYFDKDISGTKKETKGLKEKLEVKREELAEASAEELPILKEELKELEDRYSQEPWRLRYAELDGVPASQWPQAAIDYAIEDSVYAYDIAKIQSTVPLDYKLHVRTEILLNLMGQKGLRISMDRVKQTEQEIYDYILPRYNFLIEKGFMVYDEKKDKYRKKMKDLREHVVATFENVEYTTSKNVSTKTQHLEKYLLEKEDEVVNAFLEVAQFEKALTAFVNNLLGSKDGIIRTTYNGCVETGRTSSSKSFAYASVNIQQMPRELKGTTWDIRNCFVPREGFKIVSIDYTALEVSAVGNGLFEMFGYSKLQQFLNSGDEPQDSHSNFAARLMSMEKGRTVTYEEFVSRKKEPEFKAFRAKAKPPNLSFAGGIGIDAMEILCNQAGVKVNKSIIHKSKDERQIDKLLFNYRYKYPSLRKKRLDRETWALEVNELVLLKEEYLKLYPELAQFLQKTHLEYTMGEKMRVKNDFGEWEWEDAYAYEVGGFKRRYCNYTAFCNGTLMQSPGAIGAKTAACEIVEKYFEHPDVNPLAFIHDEIVAEVRDDENIYNHVDDLSRIMVAEMQKVLPNVRIAVEAELMDYWMKAGGYWSKAYWMDPGSNILRSK